MSRSDYRAVGGMEIEHREAPAIRHDFRIVVSDEAFDRIVVRGAEGSGREVGGVLVGELLQDGGGPYVRVDTTIDALHAEEKDAELTLTHATWDHIHREMDTAHAGKRIVGWYHTHPGFGVFLSDRDRFIQQSFFDMPFQIAVVYDSGTREHGVFAWRDGRPWRLRQYWLGGREFTWDGPREGTADRRSSREPAPERPAEEPRASVPPPAHRSGDRDDPDAVLGPNATLAIAVAAVLAAGVLGWYLGGRSADRDAAQERTELADTREELARHRLAIGVLLSVMAEQAVKGGDARRARTLLDVAAQVDEANREAYAAQLRAVAPGASLSPARRLPGASDAGPLPAASGDGGSGEAAAPPEAGGVR